MLSEQETLCRRLKQARQENNIKQETVARYLAVPTSAVSAFESGHRKLRRRNCFCCPDYTSVRSAGSLRIVRRVHKIYPYRQSSLSIQWFRNVWNYYAMRQGIFKKAF